MEPTILPIVYLGNIHYYQTLLKNNNIVFDKYEHFVKQTYRNRAEIYGANGKLTLIIPIDKRKERTPIKNVKIDYNQQWQKIHWKSFESAYRSSPYFEFYENEFHSFYHEQKHTFLIDYNLEIQQTILNLLNSNIENKYTAEYLTVDAPDYRKIISPKNKTKQQYPSEKYLQVFDNKHGFIPNLSIIDLLFNEGPNATSFLN